MMLCPTCQTLNETGSRFCQQCGGGLPQSPPHSRSLPANLCLYCRKPLTPGWEICLKCGRVQRVWAFPVFALQFIALVAFVVICGAFNSHLGGSFDPIAGFRAMLRIWLGIR